MSTVSARWPTSRPGADSEADPVEELVELELATAGLAEFRAVATQLHVLASRV